MSPKTRLFLILWIAGFVSVLSITLIDLTALLANLPVTAQANLPLSPLQIKLVSTIQPTVLMSMAVFIGVRLANRVGLFSPAAEAAAGGGQVWAPLKPQIVPGLIGGLIGGIAILSTWLLWKPYVPVEFATRAERLNKVLPFLTRVLYGGIVEELLLRWGLMTLLVWLAWILSQGRQGKPRRIFFVGAIIISSVLFGMGHLPIAVALGVALTAAIVSYIVVANSIFGLIAGYLYWKKGLEAAIIAHMLTHVVIVTAIYFAA